MTIHRASCKTSLHLAFTRTKAAGVPGPEGALRTGCFAVKLHPLKTVPLSSSRHHLLTSICVESTMNGGETALRAAYAKCLPQVVSGDAGFHAGIQRSAQILGFGAICAGQRQYVGILVFAKTEAQALVLLFLTFGS